MSASIDNVQETDHGYIWSLKTYGNAFFISWMALNGLFWLLTIHLLVRSVMLGNRFVKMMA